jgi:hypothetical protein
MYDITPHNKWYWLFALFHMYTDHILNQMFW